MGRAALRALSLAAAGYFLASARQAHAEPLPIDLSWEAPPECPSYDEVMAELSRITRVKPGRTVTHIRADAQIEHTADNRYRLRLRTQREDQSGDTDLDAATCAVLKRGVTLVLALALGDGVDLVDEPAPPPPPVDVPEPPAAPPPPVARPKPPVPVAPVAIAPSSEVRWSPWLAATGASGLTAKAALGPQIGLELGQLHWHALAQLSYWPSASAPRAQGIDSSYSAFIGALGGCGRVPFGAWSLSACATFEAGVVRGASAGAFQDGAATAPWYAVGPSLVLAAPLSGSLKLRVAGGLSVAFEPPHFAIRGFREVYVVSRYVPALTLGLAL